MEAVSPCDVTAVITFHREGLLAHRSLLSLGRCVVAANAAGISVEVIATLDRSDSETQRVVRQHGGPGKPHRILELDVGDLGLSRNAAVRAASGPSILICDGDDYLSASFIVDCKRMLDRVGDLCVLHPQLVVTFEGEHGAWWQTGNDDAHFDSACMLVCNPWNSCCFTSRETLMTVPYLMARPGESGFGFEDWHWNCETLASGHPHLVVPETVHYVRKKLRGSLNNAHAANRAIIAPSRLFALR